MRCGAARAEEGSVSRARSLNKKVVEYLLGMMHSPEEALEGRRPKAFSAFLFFPATHAPSVPSTLKLTTARPTPHPIRIALFRLWGTFRGTGAERAP